MCFFLNAAVLRVGKQPHSEKRCMLSRQYTEKACEEADHTISMRHCGLLITQKQSDTADIV
jgi:hypothetical protein